MTTNYISHADIIQLTTIIVHNPKWQEWQDYIERAKAHEHEDWFETLESYLDYMNYHNSEFERLDNELQSLDDQYDYRKMRPLWVKSRIKKILDEMSYLEMNLAL